MKKSEIAELYEKYLGPKCSRTTYYKNIRDGMMPLDALKPIPKEKRYSYGLIRSRKFESELERFKQQPGEKPTRARFYQRLYQGWPKEEAIKLVVEVRRNNVRPKKAAYVRPITPIKREGPNKDYEDIRIRYSHSEAVIFSREYERMIEELQNKYFETDDIIEAREINNSLEKLIKEYQTFRLYNAECKSPSQVDRPRGKKDAVR